MSYALNNFLSALESQLKRDNNIIRKIFNIASLSHSCVLSCVDHIMQASQRF